MSRHRSTSNAWRALRCAVMQRTHPYAYSKVTANPIANAFAAMALAIAFATTAQAAEPTIEFVVARSDTLIGLSSSVLTSQRAWREVARLNKLANPNLIYPGQVLNIPTRLLRGNPVYATLVSVVGDVRSGDAPAAIGAAIGEGASLQTGANSSAVIELADGSRMRLPASSLAQLAASRTYGQRGSTSSIEASTTAGSIDSAATGSGWFAGTLRVLRGSVEVFATRVLRAKPLEVVTPTAVVGIRGTVYRVGLDESENNRAHAEVLEGMVRQVAADGSSGGRRRSAHQRSRRRTVASARQTHRRARDRRVRLHSIVRAEGSTRAARVRQTACKREADRG
jgi:hypothetical protein